MRTHKIWAVPAISIAAMLSSVVGRADAQVTQPEAVTAIDILVEPDQTMFTKAAAANERLRMVFPKGFALD